MYRCECEQMCVAYVKKICSGLNVLENWFGAFTATKIDYLLWREEPYQSDTAPCLDGDTYDIE